jgi:hypothetical protein
MFQQLNLEAEAEDVAVAVVGVEVKKAGVAAPDGDVEEAGVPMILTRSTTPQQNGSL